MDCLTARERMLEAPPGALSGHGESALAAHLAACDGCRRIASTLTAQLADLARDLNADPQRSAIDAVVRAAIASVAVRARPIRPPTATAPVPAAPGGPPSTRKRTRRVAAAGGAGFLAAATAVLLLTDGNGETAPTGRAPARADVSPAPARAIVNAPEDRDVAIFRTADPRITVVWYLPRSR